MKQNNNIIPFRPKKLSGMERVAIASCTLVSLVAIVILVYLCVSANATYDATDTTKATTVADLTTVQITENDEDTTTETIEDPTTLPTTENVKVEHQVFAPVLQFKPDNSPPPEEIYNLQEKLSSWFLENESTDPITLWKKSDSEGGLLISLRNEEDETIATFRYDIEVIDEDFVEAWVLVGTTTTQEIIDITFVGYREVSGNNPINVQAQVGVLFNRVESKSFDDSIREVITAKKQYACKKDVLNRELKSSNNLEREDLEKCFREVLKVLANEGTLEVPENVVFAAMFKQGSGIWKVIDGTYYCYE